jgi:protein O-GlcNAc transferase
MGKGKKKRSYRRTGARRASGLQLPAPIQALLKKGIRHHEAGRLDEAAAIYGQVLKEHQQTPDALSLLGLISHRRRQPEDALTLIRAAIEMAPGVASYHYNLGVVLQAEGQLPEAIESYETSLSLSPGDVPAMNNLIIALNEMGEFDRAVSRLEQELESHPNDMIRISLATMLPTIMGSREEVQRSRERFEREVDRLLQEDLTVSDPVQEGGLTNFYLAYHGLNDRDLQMKVARLYERACPALLHRAPHCEAPSHRSDGRLRVGFFSNHLFEHSVMRCYARTMEMCAQCEGVDVTLLTLVGAPEDEATAALTRAAQGGRVPLPRILEEAREAVSRLELDALIYLDIGMDFFSYMLAFARLAPVQCVMTGHPVTTGIGNVDHFISWDPAEPEDAAEHYSENLVRLEHGGVSFIEPPLPPTPKTREMLGLPERANLYACPVNLMKLHPDFDPALAEILARDADAEIVFFQNPRIPFWHQRLQERMAASIPEGHRDRIRFLPWITSGEDFLSMLMAADVVLDPFHFGAHSTAVLVYAAGTPFVTLAGRLLRERVGAGFNRLIGVPECTASSPEEYVRIAVQLATDRAVRQTIQRKIETGRKVLFQDHRAADELTEFLKGICAL